MVREISIRFQIHRAGDIRTQRLQNPRRKEAGRAISRIDDDMQSRKGFFRIFRSHLPANQLPHVPAVRLGKPKGRELPGKVLTARRDFQRLLPLKPARLRGVHGLPGDPVARDVRRVKHAGPRKSRLPTLGICPSRKARPRDWFFLLVRKLLLIVSNRRHHVRKRRPRRTGRLGPHRGKLQNLRNRVLFKAPVPCKKLEPVPIIRQMARGDHDGPVEGAFREHSREERGRCGHKTADKCARPFLQDAGRHARRQLQRGDAAVMADANPKLLGGFAGALRQPEDESRANVPGRRRKQVLLLPRRRQGEAAHVAAVLQFLISGFNVLFLSAFHLPLLPSKYTFVLRIHSPLTGF